MMFSRSASLLPDLRWIRRPAALALAFALILVGSFALTGTAEAQSKSLNFDNSPASASVISGFADKNVVRVWATGIKNHKRIRYAISGDSAFSITPRSGRVRYDGTPISAGSVSLTVTARDARGEYESASLTLDVNVSPSALATSNRCAKGMRLSDGESCAAPVSQITLEVRNGNACWRLGKLGTTFCIFGGGIVNGLGVKESNGGWTIVRVPKKDR